MARLPLKPSVIKRLFALSGNKCAYPNCPENLVNAKGKVMGEICHIEAAEKGGERFNEKSNDEYRRSFENLILMCGKHHKETNDINEYTTPKLKKFKADHEKRFLKNTYKASDQIVQQAIENYMKQENKNSGSGTQINNQAHTQNIGTQIGSQHIHNYGNEKDKPFVDGARAVIVNLKKIIDSNKKQASPPDVAVIDYQNELQDKIPRPVELIPTRLLKFRKDNGRIKADVESHEKTFNVILDESDDETQKLLRSFLIKNDPEKNDELKKALVHKGQKDPAIITCDGFLINGNRRKMALEELFQERNHDPKYEMMRVVILPEGATELNIQKIENRLQLQSEGKSEYQGLNRALTIRANERKNFPLEAQLRDDPNYHDLGPKEFKKVVEEYRKKYLLPLEMVDKYLSTFNREGLYNTISEGTGDKEGRWQAFIDYSNFYNGVLKNKSKHGEYNLKENEVGRIENAISKIIRKRSLNSKELESSIGKVHDFIRKAPKYIKNTEAKKFLLKIADEVKEDIPEEMKYDKQGKKYDERDIDEKWGNHFRKEILGNLIQAHRILNNQAERIKPIELLEDSLKKLNHENMKIDGLAVESFKDGLDLCIRISERANEIYKLIDNERGKFNKLKGKKQLKISSENNKITLTKAENLKKYQISQLEYFGFEKRQEGFQKLSNNLESDILAVIRYFKEEEFPVELASSVQTIILESEKKQEIYNKTFLIAKEIKEGVFEPNSFLDFKKYAESLPRRLKQHQVKAAFHLYSLKNGANFSVPGSGKTSVVLSVYEKFKSEAKCNTLFVIGPPSQIGRAHV